MCKMLEQRRGQHFCGLFARVSNMEVKMVLNSKRSLSTTFAAATIAALTVSALPGAAESGDPIRELTLISRAQAASEE